MSIVLSEIDVPVNEYNYLSIQLLEHLGILSPTQEQIDLVEEFIIKLR